tara:strand:- start:1150 stop:1695 length:546 start_codon:yes stop_codon:yes gene_type:complete
MKDNYDILPLKKKKKKVNSRTKGNTFERSMAKLLNEKFSTDEFSRSPGSGAFATTHKLPEHLKIFGDLITPKEFKYTIECKKGYNKENIYSLLNDSSKVWEFIRQSEKDAEACGKLALLLYKQDRQKTLAIAKDGFFPQYIKNICIISDSTGWGKKYRIYYFEELLEKIPKQQWYTAGAVL